MAGQTETRQGAGAQVCEGTGVQVKGIKRKGSSERVAPNGQKYDHCFSDGPMSHRN